MTMVDRDRGRRIAALLLAVLVGVAWSGTRPASAQTWSTVQSGRQLSGQSELGVSVEYGAGEFSLAPAPPGQLYRFTLRYDEERAEPVHEFSGSQLTVGVDGNSRGVFRDQSRRGELSLELSDRVPIELSIQMGAVEADIELGGMRLRSLSIQTGASETDISVSAPNPETMSHLELQVGAASFEARDLGRLNAERISLEAGAGSVLLDLGGLTREETRMDLEMGLGSLEVLVPRDVGIRLNRDSFLISLDTPGMTRRGDDLVSDNWDSAPRRLVVELDAALGSVSFVRRD